MTDGGIGIGRLRLVGRRYEQPATVNGKVNSDARSIHCAARNAHTLLHRPGIRAPLPDLPVQNI